MEELLASVKVQTLKKTSLAFDKRSVVETWLTLLNTIICAESFTGYNVCGFLPKPQTAKFNALQTFPATYMVYYTFLPGGPGRE